MQLLPPGLETSLFPAIFVGVLVTFLATETLGWTFTGLVVPGYLGAVALVAPEAAALMTAEGVVAFGLVRLLSDGAARVGAGSRLFGRERFFLVLAVATAVRLAVERGLPLAGIDRTAHSIGLVLVPLMAHTLDKLGVGRGLAQLGALTGVTSLVIAAMDRFTNLTLADLSLTFEDVAFSIDHHPRAYVVLLCAALLAARANVAFGWDFHGIIVPGLLAVAWSTPGKVAVTLVEAFTVAMVARAAMRLPGLRTAQVEGPRRLVFVFVVDAVLRVAAVTLLGPQVPLVKASDLYGFGYLLPTLLAVKIWQKHSAGRVLLPAAQVSLGGFLLGNALVLAFGWFTAWSTPEARLPAVPAEPPTTTERAIAVARSYVARDGERTRMHPHERAAWEAALARYASGAPPDEAFAGLAGRLAVTPLADDPGAVVVREAPAAPADLRGLGVLVARPGGRQLVVAVPRPLDGPLTLAAVEVARLLDARGVAVAGRPEGGGTPLLPDPYALARDALAGDAWLELVVDDGAAPGGELRVGDGRWPDGVHEASLREVLPAMRVVWGGRARRLSLAAPTTTWRAIVTRSCAAGALAVEPFDPRVVPARAPSGDDELDVFERLFYAEEVLAPLAAGARAGHAGAAADVCRAADVLGLIVRTWQDADGATHLAALPAARAATAAIVRVAPGGPIVGAPRSDTEPFTSRAAFSFYQTLEARALVLGATSAGVGTYDAALAAIGEARDPVLEVRGAGAPPGLPEQAVITWGGVGGAPDVTPEWVAPFEEAARRIGVPARRWGGTLADRCCGDLGGDTRARLGVLGGARAVTLFLSAPARQRRFGAAGVASAATLAGALGLRVDDGALPAVLERAVREAPCAPAASAFRRARRWAQVRHVEDLRALVASGSGRVSFDTSTGETFAIVASRCGRQVELGVVNLRDPGDHPPVVTAAPLDPATIARLRAGGVLALWATGQEELR